MIATGSEVEIAFNVATRLNEKTNKIRVVSMPSTDVYDKQEINYKETVLPSSCRNRIAIEAGVTDYWIKYTGLDGLTLGVDTFGESAPAKEVFAYFELTENNLEKRITNLLKKKKV